ncbi:hypothetical protein HN592_04385 [Candidatus Woesearchaeota archaeon]|jgi:hypothetical protein|nr:hypothetical protein [Candidatus Woesearchaeota archaeon]MBT4368451.1 hypothetical protein [Candidatus Woesearchaeota archaeon]MBT4712940.1 hypothetical protein [Candidatus Woesearchaeota archaeon]MBT6639852.1 hypothetical protein [Candidatus Woesearchaeota archaeon]MBT7134024.1 hypothetical protein [Candidatus Woesearchaeota archaeon]
MGNGRAITVEILFLLVLIIISIVSFNYIANIDEYIPPQRYLYGVELDSTVADTVSDLKIYHDFTKSQGKITFAIAEEDYLGKPTVNIELPTKISNVDANVDFKKKGSVISFTPIKAGEFEVTYKMFIEPSGTFVFSHTKTKLAGTIPKVSFDLGKNYKCTGNCIPNFSYMQIAKSNSIKEVAVEFERTENTVHYFDLIGIRDIRKQQGVAIAFGVSSLLSAILIIKEILERFYR